MIATIGLAGLALCAPGHATAQVRWRIGPPIATYWAGPPITESSAKQMKEGGFNLIWCTKEEELDTARRFGLHAMLQSDLISPEALDDPQKLAKLDGFIARVKTNSALYAYFITDEPSAAQFPGLGKLVAYLRGKDPAHLAYINLFPTYASNQQLGVSGDVLPAYREYVHRFIDTVKPSLLSYDHYHFNANGDGDQYFLNLGIIRQAALDAGIPFLNIVQACRFNGSMRTPTANQMHWLSSTSLAFGAQGLSYFVYFYQPLYDQFKENAGMMTRPDGTPTALYEGAKVQLPEFVNVATQLQALRSLGVYHGGAVPPGFRAQSEHPLFRADIADQNSPGVLIGYFGEKSTPTYAFVVNLDYNQPLTTTVHGPGPLEVFDATAKTWKAAGSDRVPLVLGPGAGKLVRVRR
ncbi:MAG: hypothetical protein ACHQ50_06105 [Fimbriimonadales bacterium]